MSESDIDSKCCTDGVPNFPNILHGCVACLSYRLNNLENSPFLKSKTYEPLFERFIQIEYKLESDKSQIIKMIVKENNKLENDLIKLQLRIDKLEKVVETLSDISKAVNRTIEGLHFLDANQKPYRCPVCEGRPIAELRITKTNSGNDKLLLECHACEGKGVIWG